MSFDGNNLPVEQLGLFGLFLGTIDSLLCITTPWSGYLESTLLVRTLEELGERGQTVFHYSDEIQRIATENEALHWKMLDSLFGVIFGERTQVLTSEDLLQTGFDDAKEPEISDYYDLM